MTAPRLLTVLACSLIFVACGDSQTDDGDDDQGDTGVGDTGTVADSESGADSEIPGDSETEFETVPETDPEIDTGEADTEDNTVYVYTNDSPCYEEGEDPEGHVFPCDWVTVEGGTFMMGSPDGMGEEVREYPQHEVTLPAFQLWRTEVTVTQYLECSATGWCTPVPLEDFYCNTNYPVERADHPVNCIDWHQAREFCLWLGGRLATEAEWEYAARSRGQDILYPWGDEEPTCELAVIDVEGVSGPGGCDDINTTHPVCSHPLGNSVDGICDFVGNVYSWVEDWFHVSYEYEETDGVTYRAPEDGSAWIEPPNPYNLRLMRGGGIGSPGIYRTTYRQPHEPHFTYGGLGVRCARDI